MDFELWMKAFTIEYSRSNSKSIIQNLKFPFYHAVQPPSTTITEPVM